MLVIGVFSLVLLAHQCVSARQVPGDHSVSDSAGASPLLTLANPFSSGEENRRLMQSYIKANLKEGQEGPDTSWEQEVFYLFSLHDYDRSGTMDGLELMKLLSEFNSHKTPGEQSTEPVVAMVDFLLQTQDLNGDGLIAPSELLSPPKLQQPNSNSHGAPDQGGVVAQEQVDVKEDVNPEEMKHEGDRQEVMTDEHFTQEEQKQEEERLHAEAPAADQEQKMPASVHQGQSEM
ncbi:cell growth regulator with EF hand domain protein 1 [Esox lucius]|uniref:EF-hand domain-containing protein n=1 Tax=Esox lucius TaxID=8010 RepID=A0A6Q2XUB4_ESOLU|nr:cell growth regulator with EF hand domain protein 1 [Esox lucius]